MSDPFLLEHLFFFLFVVVYPALGFVSHRRFLARIAAGEEPRRRAIYRQIIIPHWVLFGITLVFWWSSGRPWSALGVTLELNGANAVGAVFVLVVLAAELLLLRKAQTGRISRERLLGDGDQMAAFLPHRRDELRGFYLLSFTAGVVEELLWRGYLIWYLQLIMPLWLAGVLSTALFGLAHAYQGLKSLPVVTLVGGVLTALYLLTGSLLLVIVLHAAFDALQGRLAYEVLARDSERA